MVQCRSSPFLNMLVDSAFTTSSGSRFQGVTNNPVREELASGPVNCPLLLEFQSVTPCPLILAKLKEVFHININLACQNLVCFNEVASKYSFPDAQYLQLFQALLVGGPTA